MSRRRPPWPVPTVAAALLLLAVSARADEGNYQLYPLGERATGMGGAFAAMVDDGVLAFYNPAGLAVGRNSTISVSMSVYGIFERTVDRGGWFGVFEREPGEDGLLRPVLVDLEYREFPPATIPTTVVLVRRIGPRFEDRSPRQTFAWSTLVPRSSDLSYSLSESWDYDDDPATEPDEHRLSLRETDRLVLVGPSYAFRITETLSIGLSAFAAIRTFSHSSRHTWFNEDEDPGVYGISVEEIDLRGTVYSGIFRAGVHWEPARGYRLGLMISSPSFEVYSEGSYRLRDLDTFSGEFDRDENDDTAMHDLLPFELRLGFAREVPGSFALSVDVSVYGPGSYDRFDLPPGWTGLSFVNRVRRDAIANVAVGAEMVLARRWPVRLGFFTDLSSVPDLEPSNVPSLPQIHRVGSTLSVGYVSRLFEINVGVLATLGSGSAHTIGPVGDPDLPTYVPTTARDRRVYFYISGYQRSLERLLGRWLDL